MGVSIIVPAKKILETLYHPQLVAMRKAYCDKLKNKNQPTADSTLNMPFTKLDFEAAQEK
jgi:hypothetical protein